MTAVRVKKALLHITSDDSLDNANRGCFETTIGNTQYKNLLKVVPRHIAIPNLFPNVDYYNNRIVFAYPDQIAGSVEIAIPIKQYTALELAAFIKSIGVGLGYVQDFTFDETIKKFKITMNPDYTIGFTAESAKLFGVVVGVDVNVGPSIGFTTTTWYMLPASTTPTAITPSQTPNLGGVKTVLVHMDDIADGNLIDTTDPGSHTRNVAFPVSLHNVPYGHYAYMTTFDENIDELVFDNVKNIHRVRVCITDAKYRPLDLHPHTPIDMILSVYHMDG